jgi:hypothetical protein
MQWLRQLQAKADVARAARGQGRIVPRDGAVLGEFLCLVENRWDEGLELLAEAAPGPLGAVAKKDRARPADPEARLALADAWWSWAESQPRVARNRYRARAAYWYALAKPGLKGLAAVRAENRVAEVIPAPSGKAAAPETSVRSSTPGSKAPAAAPGTLGGVQAEERVRLVASAKAYRLRGEYRVPEGKTLEIEAGVLVLPCDSPHPELSLAPTQPPPT